MLLVVFPCCFRFVQRNVWLAFRSFMVVLAAFRGFKVLLSAPSEGAILLAESFLQTGHQPPSLQSDAFFSAKAF